MIATVRFLLVGVTMQLSASMVAAAVDPNADGFDLANTIGVFAAKGQGAFCLSIQNPALKPGQTVTLFWTPIEAGTAKPEIRRGRIAAKLAAPCDPTNHVPDNSIYQLAADKFERGRVYFAIVGAVGDPRLSETQASAVLANAGRITFRSCTSMEGLHLFAASDVGLKGKTVWHSYYYLGYDVEPTCKEADFKN
jgi:hypothetical protein